MGNEGASMPKGVSQKGKMCRAAILMSVFMAAFLLIFFPQSSLARDYIVRKGDHLVRLGKRFGVPWEEIKRINRLSGSTIYPGQKLIIPELALQDYVVRRGDSLIGLGKKFNVSWQEIKRMNGLSGTTIYPGDKLIIPLKGVWHVVKKHEWLLLIARTYGKAYGVTKEEIIKANRLSDPDNLKLGQRLFIPRAQRVLDIKIPPRIVTRETAPSPRPAQAEASRVEKKEAPLEWPLRGEVIGYFGDEGNRGIDIAGSEGETVVAAADGEVAYAAHLTTSGRNYGHTVFINHEKERLVTCYYYNARSLVDQGQKVKKGDPIAKVGVMEGSGRFGLHFEVRKMSKPVNPLDYLP